MIDLYTWTTPNGRKPAILLEELGLAYDAKPVDISKDEQFAPEFLKISPNNKIPAIVDHDADGGPLAVFESGAILIYLAEKTGSALLPASGAARAKTLEWLMFQMGGLGPMFGQYGHFVRFAPEKVPYGIKRYTDEANRIYRVLDKRLGETAYMAGDDYSIADIATYPWLMALDDAPEIGEIGLARGDNIRRWMSAIGARPAVERGMAVLQST